MWQKTIETEKEIERERKNYRSKGHRLNQTNCPVHADENVYEQARQQKRIPQNNTILNGPPKNLLGS